MTATVSVTWTKGGQKKACWEHRTVRLPVGMNTSDQIMVSVCKRTFLSPLDISLSVSNNMAGV